MNDLISRQYAIKRFGEDGTWLERQGVTTLTMVEAKQRAVDILESLPSEDRPTGKWWIREYEFFTCSECGDDYWNGCDCTEEAEERLRNGDYPKFCSNCGVRMEV